MHPISYQRTLRAGIMLAGICMLFSACALPASSSTPSPSVSGAGQALSPAPTASDVSSPATVTDALGREILFDGMPSRVVALIGSFGEVWLNAGGSLIGITSDAVEERTFELPEGIAAVGSVHEPNLELVLALEPDFVILSADLTAHQQLAQTLEQAGVPYGLFHMEFFDDYLQLLENFTDLTGRKDLYEQNGLDVKARIDDILAAAGDRFAGQTVLFVRAYSTSSKAKGEDVMAGAMLRDFGLENIVSRHESLLDTLSMEAIIAEDPDYIFVTTMGSDAAALDYFSETYENNPAWAGLSAVKNGRFFLLPKDLFHYKPNARWADSYQYLLELLEGSLPDA